MYGEEKAYESKLEAIHPNKSKPFYIKIKLLFPNDDEIFIDILYFLCVRITKNNCFHG